MLLVVRLATKGTSAAFHSPSAWCREVTTLTQDSHGREEVDHGTACRQPDGQSGNTVTPVE